MTTIRAQRIPHRPDLPHGLGRHVEHDERSRAFAAPIRSPRTVRHVHHGPVLDQGQTGSCTGNALAQALNTGPLANAARKRTPLTEQDALSLYSAATSLDSFPGTYPPDDTGSTGLAVCKAAQRAGLVHSYSHAFGLAHVLGALAVQPVIVGTEWTDGMFTPDERGYLQPTGNVAGGHEYLLLGCDVASESVLMLNSWGSSWGKNGTARITWDVLGQLLANGGDCTVPTIA